VYSSDGRLQREVKDDISLVNLYRLVFRIYFGSEVPLLPNRSYFASFKDLTGLELVDATRSCSVTNTVAGHANPPPSKP
jgi:hypothetical protein